MLQVKILQRRLILNFLCLLALIIHELESTIVSVKIVADFLLSSCPPSAGVQVLVS